MNQLSAFLKANAAQPNNETIVVSRRFTDEEGNPVPWEIRALSSAEESRIRSECERRVPVPGKRGLYVPETDSNLYQIKVLAASTVVPDLKNKELQDSYGVVSETELLRAMLLPGEMAEYSERVYALNGFETSMGELVDQAKN